MNTKIKLVSDTASSIVIENGKIKCDQGFFASLENGVLTITDGDDSGAGGILKSVMNFGRNNISIGGNGVSINGNKVSINGVEISVAGNDIIIKAPLNKNVILNGTKLTVGKDESVEPIKDNSIREYDLAGLQVCSVTVINGGDIQIKDCQNVSADSLEVIVKGSGDISVYGSGVTINNVMATVMGSGDIQFKSLTAQLTTSSVMGSGDIVFYQSELGMVSASIMGSGDISGRSTTYKSISKSVMGSGDISL